MLSEVREFLAAPGDGARRLSSRLISRRMLSAKQFRDCTAFDLGIFDEAHKTAGREGANFGFALENRNLPIREACFSDRYASPL